jgi:hypothetical protein
MHVVPGPLEAGVVLLVPSLPPAGCADQTDSHQSPWTLSTSLTLLVCVCVCVYVWWGGTTGV